MSISADADIAGAEAGPSTTLRSSRDDKQKDRQRRKQILRCAKDDNEGWNVVPGVWIS